MTSIDDSYCPYHAEVRRDAKAVSLGLAETLAAVHNHVVHRLKSPKAALRLTRSLDGTALSAELSATLQNIPRYAAGNLIGYLFD